MSTTYTVQERAQKYAEALVAFHELNLHVQAAGEQALRQDMSALRVARDAMYDAQQALHEAAERQARMNYA
jgi:hypothetical protein